MRISTLRGVWAAALTLVVLAGAAIVLLGAEAGPAGAELMAWLRGLGGWGPAALIALMVLHCFIPFPAEVLALCAGALWGVLWGTLVIWTGAMLGAALSFGLARWLGRPFVIRVLGPAARMRIDRFAAATGAEALLGARLVPVIAFNLINYAAGLTPVRWTTFLWTTAIGILPLTVLMVWAGARMSDLDTGWLIALSVAGLALIAAAALWRRRGGG